MAEFTLLKVQLDDSTFTANAPFSGSETGETTGDEADAETESADTSGGALPVVAALVGLLALAAVAVLVKKRRSTEEPSVHAAESEEVVELDDIDA